MTLSRSEEIRQVASDWEYDKRIPAPRAARLLKELLRRVDELERGAGAHEWTKHEREGWSVCSRCGMVRNYDREQTTCSGALPKIRQRSEIEDYVDATTELETEWEGDE